MKQVLLLEPGRLESSEISEPRIQTETEVLVRVHRVGICGTDIHAFKGNQPFFSYPRRLGHELGVEVIETGKRIENFKIGDRCAVEPYLTCGHCSACTQGKTNCCESLQCLGVHTEGGMCEYLCLPGTKLHRSDLLSYDQLALVETLGIGSHAVNRANLSPGDLTLIIGAGPIGLSVLEFALAKGASVILADINSERLVFCTTHFPAVTVLDARTGVEHELARLTGGEKPKTVFDCTGNKDSMEQCFSLSAPGGKIIYVGLGKFDVSFHDPLFHRKELSVLASRNATGQELRSIIHMIEQNEIDTSPWITHRSSLASIPSEFSSFTKPESGCLKAMIEVC